MHVGLEIFPLFLLKVGASIAFTIFSSSSLSESSHEFQVLGYHEGFLCNDVVVFSHPSGPGKPTLPSPPHLSSLLFGSEVNMEDAATSPFLDVIVPLHKHLLAWLPSWPQLYF